MGNAGMCLRARLAAGCLTAVWAAAGAVVGTPAFAGPPGDYGDAPVDNVGAGVDAYPGVVARWVSWFMHPGRARQRLRPALSRPRGGPQPAVR